MRVIACGCVAALCTVAQAQNQAASSSAATGQRTDGQIEMDVVASLDASSALKNDLITASTVQGEVTLAGTVSSEAASELAASIAGHVTGVAKVHNNLKVGNPEQAATESWAPADQGTTGSAGSSQAPEGANQPEEAQQSDQADQPAASSGQADPSASAPAYRQPYSSPAGASQPSTPAYPDQQQSQAQQPYPNQPQYGYSPQQRQPAYEYAKAPVALPAGTLLQLRTAETLSSKKAADGTPVQFTVIQDVTLGGVLAIPRGATVHGVVAESKSTKSGDLGGSSELALQLTSLDMGGKNYPLDSDLFKVKGPNKAGQTVGSAVAGGLLGTIIGCAAGRGAGCAIGAGAGVAAGTAAGAAAPGPNVWIPAEAQVTFHLKTPVSVDPVSPQEAQRLAQGLYSGGPSLYRRGYGAYGTPYAGYPYAYDPPVYYRPYYLAGGYYYWR